MLERSRARAGATFYDLPIHGSRFAVAGTDTAPIGNGLAIHETYRLTGHFDDRGIYGAFWTWRYRLSIYRGSKRLGRCTSGKVYEFAYGHA